MLIALLAMAMPAFASLPDNAPKLTVSTDKGIYTAGDSGTIFIQLDTYGIFSAAEIEAVVTSPEGIIIGGALIYTDIPEKIRIMPGTRQTEQVLLKEGVQYLGDEKTIMRTVRFEVPAAAPSGDYTVKARVIAHGVLLENSAVIGVIGAGAIDAILLIYIITIILVIGFAHKR